MWPAQRKEDMEDSFASESSSLFQMMPSNPSNSKGMNSELLNPVPQGIDLSKRRRSWPPGSPKDHSISDNHGIFVTCDESEYLEDDNTIFENKPYSKNSVYHNDIIASRSLACQLPKIGNMSRSHRSKQPRRRSRKNVNNNNVAERVSLFKALVHVDGENSSNGPGSEASRGLDEGLSVGGDSGNGNYRFVPDDIIIEGHSGGSIRALAVEAAFVANGILRRSAQSGKKFQRIGTNYKLDVHIFILRYDFLEKIIECHICSIKSTINII